MSKVFFEKPQIITLEYHQEETDYDYGTCLWAKFKFDLAHCELKIASACGNYSYEWIATEKEPFLNFLLRVNDDYLLDKLSSKTAVNASETWNHMYEYVKGLIEKSDAYFSHEDWDDIKFACVNTNKHRVFNEIREKLEVAPIYEYVEDSDIRKNIITDYPSDAYTIVRIFEQHIKPALKNYLEKENN